MDNPVQNLILPDTGHGGTVQMEEFTAAEDNFENVNLNENEAAYTNNAPAPKSAPAANPFKKEATNVTTNPFNQ